MTTTVTSTTVVLIEPAVHERERRFRFGRFPLGLQRTHPRRLRLAPAISRAGVPTTAPACSICAGRASNASAETSKPEAVLVPPSGGGFAWPASTATPSKNSRSTAGEPLLPDDDSDPPVVQTAAKVGHGSSSSRRTSLATRLRGPITLTASRASFSTGVFASWSR